MSETSRNAGTFMPDWLPSWETYGSQHDLKLQGGGIERRAACALHVGERGSLAVNVATGAWMCHACGEHGGDVLQFHRMRYGLGFVEAAKELGAWDAGDGAKRPAQPPRTPAKAPTPAPRHETLSALGRALWDACAPIDGDAQAYLEARSCAIPPKDADLRWHPALRHPNGYVGPALVALVTDTATGTPMTLHRTWILADGRKAAVAPPRLLLPGHRKAGGVIRLWPAGPRPARLGIAEGIETSLSLALVYLPVWAAIDAGNLASFPVLPTVRELLIGADNDPAGVDAARRCSERWTASGRVARVAMPPPGKDFNDISREDMATRVRAS